MYCPSCNKILKNNKSLKYHIDHNVCKKNKNVCEKCHCCFSTKQRLIYHLDNDVCRRNHKNENSLITIVDCPENNQKKERVVSLKKEILDKYDNLSKEELMLKLANLEGQCQTLKENPHNIYIDKQQINQFYIQVPPAFLTLDTFPTLIRGDPVNPPSTNSK